MSKIYIPEIFNYKRLLTREVKVGDLLIGNNHPIRVQTMTTTDTMDTAATVAQTIKCIEAGAELVRITAPSKNEAENLLNIKNELKKQGYNVPLIADIHFTPNAAEIAARLIEKVRVNPGNYIDKKKFDTIEYTDIEYNAEIERISERFTPLVKICKEYGTAMRIGTNHGSLSDRIMSRYGDTPIGMVESAMEFLRVARYESFHNIILSMKSSNPQVMVQAYRLLAKQMIEEFGEAYPLHLGVTEAGDGEDGRIKSAMGIGTLLEEGLGDTIRVSLTEDPEFEIPVCNDIVERFESKNNGHLLTISNSEPIHFNTLQYTKRISYAVQNIGNKNVPVVIADIHKLIEINQQHLQSIGYTYNLITDKWNISDAAADFIYTANQKINFELPGTLRVIVDAKVWQSDLQNDDKYLPIFDVAELNATSILHKKLNFVMLDITDKKIFENTDFWANKENIVISLSSTSKNALQDIRFAFNNLIAQKINNPVIVITESSGKTLDEHLIHFSIENGGLLLDGLSDGICLGYKKQAIIENTVASGRTYLEVKDINQFTNNTAFSILQASRTRISKTEYISCPSCGRTLFDLQETTAKIRAVTHHLKGLKIAIMGCIVNGPGEMADADFGYVGSGPGKITLYKNKDVVKKNIPSETAVDELILLLKENNAWIDPV